MTCSIKRYFLIVILFVPFLCSGQQEDSISLKVNSKDLTLELQLTPLGNQPISINGIRTRWFTTEQFALRFDLFLAYDADDFIIQQQDIDVGNRELVQQNSEFTFSIKPGFEKHLKGTKRLSPYFGVEADITVRDATFYSEQQNLDDVNYIKVLNEDRKGFVRLGLNAIAGFDFYCTNKLYLGTEIGLGFSSTRFKDETIESNLVGFQAPIPVKHGRSFDFGPNVLSQIRLGYAF